MKKGIAFIVAILFIITGGTALAASYKPAKLPDAPADYQKKKNPLKSKKKIVKDGGKIYKRKCKKCHGEAGDGQGSAAGDLGYAPTAFSKPGYLKGRSDGQLFFIIEKGSAGTDMEAMGKGTAVNLSEEEIWKVITFMRKEFTK